MEIFRKSLGFILLFISFHYITAKSQEIQFDKVTHDFGRVANMEYPPAVFSFTNNSLKKTAVLMIQKSKDVLVQFERKYLLSGETGRIMVKYNANALGTFDENLDVVFSSLDKPITLNIKGENTTVLNCFPNPDNYNSRLVYVIDRVTKEPVPNAGLKLLYNKREEIVFTVDELGKSQQEMKIGLYDAAIVGSGYVPYDSSIFVSKSQPYVYFEMQPLTPPVFSPSTEPESEIFLTEITSEPPEPPELPKPDNPNELSRLEYAENNVVLLVDVSLSMRSGKKLDLLKESMKNLVSVLRNIDRVTLISYASLSKVHCKGISGDQDPYLSALIDSLSPYGITNGVKGLETAYQLAQENFVPNGNNQVILATDGKFTGSSGSEDVYESMIREQVDKNILLSIIGFGIDREAIELMKKMAIAGEGAYIHVDKESDASSTFIDEIKQRSKKNIH